MRSRVYHALLFTVVLLFNRVATEEVRICLTENSYSNTLTCSSPLQIKIQNIDYAVSDATCVGDCCSTANISCTENRAASGSLLSTCDSHDSCVLSSGSDISALPIQCPGENEIPASFAVIHYTCEAVPEPTTTSPSTTSVSSPGSDQETTTINDKTTKKTGDYNKGVDSPGDVTSDLGLTIGLSVAGGVLIIIIVVIIVVFIAKSRRHDSSNQSQNSTKTLASSDIEANDSSENGRGTSDPYGFHQSSTNQQQRLQKRNDNIKRNLSFKTEESKNKRPPKLSKSKSKSKSSSLDHLNTNNSNNKTSSTKESHKGKRSTSDKKKKTATTEEKHKTTKGKATPVDEQQSKNSTERTTLSVTQQHLNAPKEQVTFTNDKESETIKTAEN